MGVVYKARDPLLDRVVAVKTIMSPQEQGRRVRSAFLERFQREAKAAAKMQHPAIVTIFDVGVDEETGAPFMVLEYLPGESLADRLDRVRIPLARCVQIALDLASRAVVRAPPAHRPPRRQAGERAARRRQPLEARRFRHRAHARLRSHAGRHLHGHARLLAARGDPRGPLHAAGRRVRVGRGDLRAAVRAHPVRGPRHQDDERLRRAGQRAAADAPRPVDPRAARDRGDDRAAAVATSALQGRVGGGAGAARGVGALPDPGPRPSGGARDGGDAARQGAARACTRRAHGAATRLRRRPRAFSTDEVTAIDGSRSSCRRRGRSRSSIESNKNRVGDDDPTMLHVRPDEAKVKGDRTTRGHRAVGEGARRASRSR